jgi:DNA-binding transcriptional LysR family regulator
MTQPGVSQHLKHLEDYYGVRLIERKGKVFSPTEAALKLESYCHALFKEHELLKEKIKEDDPESGVCNISAPGSFALYLYSFCLELNQRFPKLSFQFTVAPNNGVIQGIRDERFVVGFVSSKTEDKDLEVSKVFTEQLLLVAPKNRKTSTFNDLCDVGFIAHPDGYRYAERILAENFPKEFRSLNDLPLKGFINQNNRILDPVAHGLGFSVVPEFTFRAYQNKDALQIVRLKKTINDDIVMVTRKHQILPQRYHVVFDEMKIDLQRYKTSRN